MVYEIICHIYEYVKVSILSQILICLNKLFMQVVVEMF